MMLGWLWRLIGHEVPYFVNMGKPVARVRHARLRRWGDSEWKSSCPACGIGILLGVRRDPETWKFLHRFDCCIRCGQRFEYTDTEINGEAFG